MRKRIFTSFAIEDERLRDLFVGHARNKNVPYDLVDMSVKQPWNESWKTQCRSRIRTCHGVIVLITTNLKKADGAIWEINCAKEEEIPILGVYLSNCGPFDAPKELYGIRKINWTWNGIALFVNSL